MQKRPYFKLGITELEHIFKDGNDNLKSLEALDAELDHRDRPKSKMLQCKVKEKINQLKQTSCPLDASQSANPVPVDSDVAQRQATEAGRSAPARVGIECAHCAAINFVSTLEGVVQHLSCSACKTPYQAIYKYSVLRTTFENKQQERPKRAFIWWPVAIAITIAVVCFGWLMKT